MQELIKTVLARIGSNVSEHTIHRINAALNYVETGRWLAANGFRPRVRTSQDRELFDLIVNEVAEHEVLYLEFGVFQGESMRYWARHLKNPRAHLHGFDSFEGLPESWNIDTPKGYFSTNGAIPSVPDCRVQFFKGWFDQTLPRYRPPHHEKLVINMDADIYSSTIYVLRTLEPLIVPGTFIYFDEFADRLNELRAFAEFLEETTMKFELSAANRNFSKVVFHRVG